MLWGVSGPRGLWEGGGHDLVAACELTCGLGLWESRARVEGVVGYLGAERTVEGGWA